MYQTNENIKLRGFEKFKMNLHYHDLCRFKTVYVHFSAIWA